MTLSMPLTIRLKTSRADVHVESQTHDLSFDSSIPGGFGTCSITLDRPLNLTPNDISYYANLYIYDSRNGAVVWEGRIEDPGKGVNDEGQIWEIKAVGPQSHASDRTFAIIYVDTSLDRWVRSQYSTRGAHTDTSEIDSDNPCLEVYAEEGSPVSLNWAGDWIYRTLLFTGQKIGRIRCTHIEGGASSNYQSLIYCRIGNATGATIAIDNWTTSPVIMTAYYGSPSGFVDGMNNASIATVRNVSATTADAFAWAKFYQVVVRAALKNADGSDITAGSSYLVNNVDPVEVIADLLGRYLNKYDGTNAILIGSGVDISQLAYPDGVTAAKIFEDLMLFDPGFYWAAWESNSAGKYRFEYSPWPTTVRYEATVIDGFDSPGSATELYNAVVIRYLDPKGKIRTTRRTQTVAELTAAGLTREEFIDLADEMGSPENAIVVGDNFLAEHKYPPNAGTLRIARPILDQKTGRIIQPWEIRPGHLIRVRGVLPRVDSLNPSSRDGVTIFKVISVSFQSSDGSATLELDSHSRTVARALAALKGRRLRKR